MSGVKEASPPSLLRKGSSARIPLKEKVVQLYEALLQGEDPSGGQVAFWNELLLLKPNVAFLDAELDQLSVEQLLLIKDNISLLFCQCIAVAHASCMAGDVTDDQHSNVVRINNAFKTIGVLVRCVCRKLAAPVSFDYVEYLVAVSSTNGSLFSQTLQMLYNCCGAVLSLDYPFGVKQQALQLLLSIVTAVTDLNENRFVEVLVADCGGSLFDATQLTLSNSLILHNLGCDCILFLTLLTQYRKHESINSFAAKLSLLNNELALAGYAETIVISLSAFIRSHLARINAHQGLFQSLTNFVGNMFSSEETRDHRIRNSWSLLALYEAVHLNRSFVTALAHCHTPADSPAAPPAAPTADPANARLSGVQPADWERRLAEAAAQPANLLGVFLEYTSLIVHDLRDDSRCNCAKLCFIILTCVSEDQYANNLMHDGNMNFRVTLHQMPMRHRKARPDQRLLCRPLACAVLDLVSEFITSHLMKAFPLELYQLALGVAHRLLCYQKRFKVRLQYDWKEFWNAIIGLLKFLAFNENHFLQRKHYDILQLANECVRMLNLFITYGDLFLSSPTAYDTLYYEIVRLHQVFDNISAIAFRCSTCNNEYEASAQQLLAQLMNIRAITTHICPQVDQFAREHQLSTLTEEQVLTIVRDKYSTLKLRLQESLDLYQRYRELPTHAEFFANLVLSVMADLRRKVHLAALPVGSLNSTDSDSASASEL